MPKKTAVNNVNKIQVIKWLLTNAKSLNGWRIDDIGKRLYKETAIQCSYGTLKRTIDDGDMGIDYRKPTTEGNNFLKNTFSRIDRLEAAYLKLCEDVGATPDPLIAARDADQKNEHLNHHSKGDSNQ